MDSLIESILVINNYLIFSKRKKLRHTIIRYLGRKIFIFVSRYNNLNKRTINIDISTRGSNIW